jgi:hypothetical protein
MSGQPNDNGPGSSGRSDRPGSSGRSDRPGSNGRVERDGDTVVVKPSPAEQTLSAARQSIRQAREAEADADPSQMSPEDRAIYHYLQAVTALLENEYDITLDSS